MYLTVVYGIATVCLGLIALMRGESFGPFQAETWYALLALGLVPQVIGHSLFNWTLRYLPALPVNIALVGEPVGSSLLAFLLLEEIPSKGLLVGSPILLAAVVMIFLRPPKTVARTAEEEPLIGS
jgi:drug/metabolite transporter (DMT)-like permease